MGDLQSRRWAEVADAHLPAIARNLKRIADVLERQEKESARPHRSPNSETFEVLEKAARKHGWNEATMFDLLSRFVDNLDLLVEYEPGMNPAPPNGPELFEKWLENKAEWDKIDK